MSGLGLACFALGAGLFFFTKMRVGAVMWVLVGASCLLPALV